MALAGAGPHRALRLALARYAEHSRADRVRVGGYLWTAADCGHRAVGLVRPARVGASGRGLPAGTGPAQPSARRLGEGIRPVGPALGSRIRLAPNAGHRLDPPALERAD